jgi:hypothetical protein
MSDVDAYKKNRIFVSKMTIASVSSLAIPYFTASCLDPHHARILSNTRKITYISNRVKSLNIDSYELALEALHSTEPGEKPNISLVARTYGVDPSNLSKRYRGVTGSKEAHYNNRRLLNEAQSRILIKWINGLTERGLPPTNAMLENFAREKSGKEPGKNWASRWKKAHSDKVIWLYSKGLDLERKKSRFGLQIPPIFCAYWP